MMRDLTVRQLATTDELLLVSATLDNPIWAEDRFTMDDRARARTAGTSRSSFTSHAHGQPTLNRLDCAGP